MGKAIVERNLGSQRSTPTRYAHANRQYHADARAYVNILGIIVTGASQMRAEASFRDIFVMGYMRPEKQSKHMEGLAQLATQAC